MMITGSYIHVTHQSLQVQHQHAGKAVEDSVPETQIVAQPERSETSDSGGSNLDQNRDQDATEQLRLVQMTGEIRELAKRDREVRTHERTHAALAGPYGGTPQFKFQRGPDGVLYAVAGHVSIDLAPIPGNPEATLRKAQTIKRAALGPSEPSQADRAVAARATALVAEASAEITSRNIEITLVNGTEGKGSMFSDFV